MTASSPRPDTASTADVASDEGTSTRVPASETASIAEREERWRRALADADNERKRLQRHLEQQARAERARTAATFLPVLDNLELALRHAQADPAAIVAGVQAVREQAIEALSKLGYQRIDAVGERFDPTRHEAAQAVEATDGVEPGSVIAVLRPGYVDADGALLRPAVVAVARRRE
jgi:molecular chaperone GrpE